MGVCMGAGEEVTYPAHEHGSDGPGQQHETGQPSGSGGIGSKARQTKRSAADDKQPRIDTFFKKAGAQKRPQQEVQQEAQQEARQEARQELPS